jgi:hypothetical protein
VRSEPESRVEDGLRNNDRVLAGVKILKDQACDSQARNAERGSDDIADADSEHKL